MSAADQMKQIGIVAVLAACSLAGCFGADLRKVHLPDLLAVDSRTENLGRPGRPLSLDQLPDAKPVCQLHASFVNPQAMIDGDLATAARVADPTVKDQYILVDLGCMTKVRQVEQIHADPQGFAAKYRIDVAGDHNFPYDIAYVGCGEAGTSVAAFAKPRRCRFLRITLLEIGPTPWNVAELLVR